MGTEMFNTSGVQLELSQTWVFSSISQSSLQRVMPDFCAGWSTWQYILTFVLGVVVYDQGQDELLPDTLVSSAHNISSDVYQAKGLNCRAWIQDPSYGTIRSSPSPQV